MREKKTKSVAIAAIDKAWAEAFADKNVEDGDLLRAQGWKTVYDLAIETGRLANTLAGSMRVAVESGKFECKKIRIVHLGKTILTNFYRPILKS
jgi:hypothetical protein